MLEPLCWNEGNTLCILDGAGTASFSPLDGL